MAHQATASQRIAYIDWLRGLACLGMFQAHGYDSWLREDTRGGEFFRYSQLLSTYPAPVFLFLAGVSLALATQRLHEREWTANEVARIHLLRGLQIFLLALLFRVQEFVLGQPHAPWTDLLRVDVLNVIGMSVMMMALFCRALDLTTGGSAIWKGADGELRAPRTAIPSVVMASAVSLAIAAATPLLWTTWRPRWLPWWLESYVNGVHTVGEPQPWLFPLFPWSAFAFAGLAAGFFLARQRKRGGPGGNVDDGDDTGIRRVAILGVGLGVLGYLLDALPMQVYAVYDFWHTSPNFFLIRLGVVSLALWVAYLWGGRGSREGHRTRPRGFSPLIEMGKRSLLIYWVHILFTYGRLSLLPKYGTGIAAATAGIVAIFAMMTLLAAARNRWCGRGDWLARLGRPATRPDSGRHRAS